MGHTCLHFTNLAFLPSQHQGTALLSCGVRPDKLFSDGGWICTSMCNFRGYFKLRNRHRQFNFLTGFASLSPQIKSLANLGFCYTGLRVFIYAAPSLNNLRQKKNPLHTLLGSFGDGGQTFAHYEAKLRTKAP